VPEKERMYRIGQFAKMSSMSVKQLRYLDEKGILTPKYRNKENNYRYYKPDQLDQLIIIKTLRDLGFSLENVVRILGEPQADHLANAIRSQMDKAEAEIHDAVFRYERLAAYYTHFLENSGYSLACSLAQREGSQRFELVRLPLKKVLFARHKASATSYQLFIDRYFQLQRECVEKRIATFSSLIAIFHDGRLNQFDDVSEDLETMISVPFHTSSYENIRMFGGFEGVSFFHKGSYSSMKKVYLEIEDWAKEQGLSIMDKSVEIYHFGPDMTPHPDFYITQVVIPLKGSIL